MEKMEWILKMLGMSCKIVLAGIALIVLVAIFIAVVKALIKNK